MLKYYFFLIAATVVPLVPPRLGNWLADRMGDIAYRVRVRARRAVKGNLRQILGPEATERRLDTLARKVFRHAARNYYDLFRLQKLGIKALRAEVDVHGMEHLFKCVEEGKGGIAVAPHLGSFDVVAQMGPAHGLKITIPVEPLKPQKLFDLISRSRAANGIRLAAVGVTARKEIFGALARNEIVAMAADRDVTGKGIPVQFFGRETTVPDAPAFLSLHTGAPVVLTRGLRNPDGTYTLIVGPRIEMKRTGDMRLDVRVNTQIITEMLERFIRENPEQWVVFEPIWPSRDKTSARINKEPNRGE